MPELPEVEMIVRSLQPLCGRTIRAVRVLDPKLSLLERDLIGERLATVVRRGKYILLRLKSGRVLRIHLRMSGRLVALCSGQEAKHVRLAVHLEGARVLFVDPRRLGTVECVEAEEAVRDLGVEPLSRSFTPRALARLLSASRAPVKVFLLDQRRIAGIGNIYAAEALWRAKISPERRARDLHPKDAAALHEAIRTVLREAIDRSGTSLGNGLSNFRPPAGRRAGYQDALAVYGQEGSPCPRCGDTIVRRKQAGRSTYLCPTCQSETGTEKRQRRRR